jgi:hypothetical protein
MRLTHARFFATPFFATPFLAILLLLVSPPLLVGCLKQAPAIVSAQPVDVRVATVLDPQDRATVQPLPPQLDKRVQAALQARNLRQKPVPFADLVGPFSKRQATVHRLGWMADHADGAEVLVLVEAEAAFYSQIQGRNRWTVKVTATVSEAGQPAEALTSTFEVPVILQFRHEQEAEALEQATPIVIRQVSRLLDQYVSSRGND